ncbi:dehydrase and lipid transport-domain-containing protein [Russula dissimulans]|nr:dehydrase and lipid transport-domain-containing protein [Russula dissimulans]
MTKLAPLLSPRYAQRRLLFSFPNFPGSADPQTHQERRVFPYTCRQLYAVVSDVASYPSFVPFCTHSRILVPLTPVPTPDSPNAQQMMAELTVAFHAFTERYTSRVTCVPYQSVRAVASSATPLFKTLETTWRFQPASRRSPHMRNPTCSLSQPSSTGSISASDDVSPTLVSLDLSFAFANPLHAAVSGAFFGKVSTLMVKAFEDRCMKVYGAGAEIE